MQNIDVHDLQSVAFPKLDEGQFRKLEGCGAATLKSYVDGETLIHSGDRDFKFFVVCKGRVEIDVIMQAFIARRHLLSESGAFSGLRVIGSRYSRDTHRIREFLMRNRVPFTWLDLETDPQVKQLLQQFGVSEDETPVVAWGRKLSLRNPSNRELAEALGIRQSLDRAVYDLVVVGAGPAGLAAAVYAASEVSTQWCSNA